MNDAPHLDPGTGLFRGLRYRPSPHRDARPPGVAVDLLVIHAISLPPGQYGGDDVAALFLGTLDTAAHPAYAALAGLRVSAHVYVRRGGEAEQFVPTHERAWHAGVSCWAERERCNDYSVGVELEGRDDDAYTPAQYRTLAALTRALQAVYPAITPDRIVGHADIAPGRKTDPGPGFDWAGFRAAIGQ